MRLAALRPPATPVDRSIDKRPIRGDHSLGPRFRIRVGKEMTLGSSVWSARHFLPRARLTERTGFASLVCFFGSSFPNQMPLSSDPERRHSFACYEEA